MMLSVKHVLLDQLAACHNDESWFKSSTTILSDIAVDEARSLPSYSQCATNFYVTDTSDRIPQKSRVFPT